MRAASPWRSPTGGPSGTDPGPTMPRELVLILDFGSQYTQLIARRVREQGVYSEIVPGTTPIAEIAGREPRALILSGSPASGYRAQAPTPDPAIYDLGRPLLGICYGFQVTAQAIGGGGGEGGAGRGREASLLPAAG